MRREGEGEVLVPVLVEEDEEGFWMEGLFFKYEASRCGRTAFTVLKEPRTSMSMTALKALGESCVRGARKLPAAPALGEGFC